jgi:hypothetical protein
MPIATANKMIAISLKNNWGIGQYFDFIGQLYVFIGQCIEFIGQLSVNNMLIERKKLL